MNYTCDYCGITKSRNDYYKNNLSKCKECKKEETRVNRINKNDIFDRLEKMYEIMNSNDMYLKEIYNILKDIRNEQCPVNTKNKDAKIEEIEKTFNNVIKYNQNINSKIDTIFENKFNPDTSTKYEKYKTDFNNIMDELNY